MKIILYQSCTLCTAPVLSISFEVDVPTGKVGGSLLSECRRHEFPGGVWGRAPQKILKFRCLEMLFSTFSRQYLGLKVIPHNCIAHPFCAYFMASFSAPSCMRTLKTWQTCLDIELCQLKNGYSSPTSTGTPPFFQVIVINSS